MTYDPNKIEEWVVASNGFWRKGDVNTDRWHVAFTGTWEQVKARSKEMGDMDMRHGKAIRALEEKHRAERKTLWPEA